MQEQAMTRCGAGFGSRVWAWLLILVFALLQAACGGGADDVALTIPVSSGYPVLGSTVTVKGANGVAVSATGDAVTGIASFKASQVATLGSPPYLVKSTGGKANGVNASDYYSLATAATGRFNVTPITHLLAVQATGVNNTTGMATLFGSGFNSARAAALTTTALATARTQVATALKATNPLIDIGTVDPLTVVFEYGDAQDALLDQIALTLKSSASVTLDTLQGNVATVAATPSGSTPVVTAYKPFNRLVVFGDSLSDGGAYSVWATAAASGAVQFKGSTGATPLQMLAAAAPYGGKFTTNPGTIWVENLAATVGYDLKPANLMGGNQTSMNLSLPQLGGCTTCTNYAQGGSRVTLQPGIGNVGTTANPQNAAVAQAGFAGNSASAPVDATPVLLGVAAADYTVTNTFLGASTLPVVQQIDQHLASSYVTAGKFAATDLVIVLAGANDVFTQAGLAGSGAITSTAAGQAVGTAAGELAAQVARLKAAGAKHLLVVGLPDMGITPAGAAQGASAAAALTQLSQSVFNATMKANLVAGVAYLDPVPLFNAVLASPASYGFSKVIDSTSATTVLESAACGPNAVAQQAAGDSASSPSSLFCSVANTSLSILGTLRAALADQTYVFADSVHPTTQMHKVLSQFVQEKMGSLLAAAIVP
ncbi:MAG: SGNH/GDSL hydrolase family protein [Rhodoferax sp.]|nr:SGNH/GDSL hydrolase family protein [Rhodoferax sp.]